jgi:D-glycero-alpha-D-manno-heptose 1-phosphate guanylyltransferase
MSAVKNTCIILAGGLGTRLRSAVPDLPKCLAPIRGRPFLSIQLEFLAQQGIDAFVLSLGYMADRVIEATSELSQRLHLRTICEDSPLGTGGAILRAMSKAGLEEALVANGDTFIDADLAMMLAPLDIRSGETLRMATVFVPDCSRYGGVRIVGRRVTGFMEKGVPGPGSINAGLYRLHKSVFNEIPIDEPFSLETKIMPRLAASGSLSGCHLEGSFIDIGVPADYYRFCNEY